MKRVLIVLLSLVCVTAGSAFGKVYTLDECINMAKLRDPRLTQFRNSIKSAKMAVWTQTGNFLPSVAVSGSYSKSDVAPSSEPLEYTDPTTGETRIIQNTATTSKYYNAGYSLSMTLFDGLRNVWGYLGSRASKRVAEYSYESELADLVYTVKGEYYFALKARRDIEVAREAVKRSEELLKLFEEKYELGSASLSEVLKQKVQFGNDQLTRVSKEKIYQVAVAELALTVGIDPNSDFEIADIEMRTETVDDVNALISEATENHPSLLAANAEISASKYDVRHAWGYYLPRLTWSYSQAWSNDTYSKLKKFGSYDNQASLSLGLSMYIFDGFTRESNMSRAKVSLSNARAQSFYAKNLVIKDVKDAYLGIKVAEETLRVTDETKRAAAEDMDLVQAKYNLGAAALWELLDAQVSLKEAQFNAVGAEFDYNLALAKLKNAMGEF